MLWLVIISVLSSALSEYAENVEESGSVLRHVESRIVGGWTVNISDHPHQVSLQSWHRHSCGGSLISPNWILTAAHCLSGSTIDYDVGLIKLANHQEEVNNTIQYATLPPEDWTPTNGSIASVTGWGTPYYGGSLMDELQQVNVPIVSNEECEEYYKNESIVYGVYVTGRMLCAGFLDGSADVCNGDSGGPLIVDGYLTGVVSWSKFGGCASEGFPAVYTSVPSLLSWIKEQTGLN
uniref:Peptidase S1 domain-containing protein n=1 Tax=Dendroctonus ponderosae TaxID=77166 RepID=A0AAR5QFA4_DENPD